MTYLELWWKHFMSYRERASLPLDDQGLVMVRGENRVSAAADSNGAGKSAVLHALSWVQFGATLGGVRGADAACRFTEEPAVAGLRFDTPNTGEFVLERQARPTRLSLTHVPTGAEYTDPKVVQEAVESHLGFGVRTFRSAVVFGQGAFERFARSDPADQLRMVDEMQGLDLRQALDRAKRWRDETREKLDDAERDGRDAAARGEQARGHVRELEEARDGFAADKASRAKEVEQRAAEWRVTVAGLQRQVKQAPKGSGETALKRLSGAQAARKAREAAYREAASSQGRASEAHRGSETALLEQRQALDRLLQAKRCPTCRRAMAEEAEVARVRKLFAPSIAAAGEAFSAAALALDAANQAAFTADSALVQAEAEEKAAQEAYQKVQAQAEQRHSAEQQLENAVGVLAQAERDVKAVRAEQWTGAAALKAAVREGLDADLAAQKAWTEADKLARTLRAAEYWVEAFGDRGIRSLLFDATGEFLTERVTAHLAVLAAGEAEGTVSATAPLKKGGVRERLHVAASWTWGAGSYAGGSDGQDRRFDLAMFAALQDLAERRSARPFPLKAWDEPGDALDGRGKEIFCRWIEQEARARGTGLLITHSEEIDGLVRPDRVWTAVLGPDGSRLVEGRT